MYPRISPFVLALILEDQTCSISGIVVRSLDSAPLKNALVQLTSDSDREHKIATKTTADGHFELRNVPAGQYRLIVSRNGYVEQELGQKKPGDQGATFTLRPGQRMTDLAFKLGRAAVITGRVSDEDGEPMPRVRVRAMRQVYREGRREFGTNSMNETNDLGEYRLFELAPGRYYVSAEMEMRNELAGDREFSLSDKGTGEKGYSRIYYPSASEPGKATSVFT